jgi:hypothetical protein
LDGDAAKIESLRRTLTWLGANARELLELRPTWMRLTKRLAELGMLANHILDNHLGRIDPMFEIEALRWIEATWEVTRRGEFFVEALDSDPTWTSLAMTYSGFHRRGMRNERFEELLVRRAAEPTHEWFVELATGCAYRAMGLPWSRNVSALAAEAWCLRIPEAQIADIGRMYETTHVIMWLAQHDELSGEARERLRRFLPRWSDHYRAAHNPDLVAELVLAAHHLGSCASRETWQWLLSLQTEDGSLREMDIPSRTLGRFHVTIVLAMAAAACLGDRCLTR